MLVNSRRAARPLERAHIMVSTMMCVGFLSVLLTAMREL